MIRYFKTGEIVKVMGETNEKRYRMYSAKILRVFENESKYEVELLDEYSPAKTMIVYDYNIFYHYPRFRECDYIQFENGIQYEVLGFNQDETRYSLLRMDTGEQKSFSVGYIDSYCDVKSRVLNGIRFSIGDEVVINSDPEGVWTIFNFLIKSVILKKDTATIELREDEIVKENLRKNELWQSIQLYDGFEVKIGDYVHYDDPFYTKSKCIKENAVWKVVKIRPDYVELFTEDGTGVIGVKRLRTKVNQGRFTHIKPVSKEEWYKYVEGVNRELNTLNLDKEQIKTLIDAALIVRDKQWFDELVERLNTMQ